MKAIRASTLLVGVLCLAGTALGQTNPLREYDPYGLNMTRLEDSSARGVVQPGTNGSPHHADPAVGAPINGYPAPEAVATPQPYQVGAFDDAVQDGGWCDDCACYLPSYVGGSQWYGYVGGLTMGRNMPNPFFTTFETGNNPNQLLYFPGADWGGGVDTRIGYWFGCGGCGDPCGSSCGSNGRFGIEAAYWGVWGLDGQSQLYSPTDQLSTPIDLGLVVLDNDPFVLASDFFDNARSHRLVRDDEVHNVEINFLYAPCCDSCSRFQFTGLAGIRFFRFDEDLQFGTLRGEVPVNQQFGQNPADEAFLNVDVENNLIGFQIGGYANCQVLPRFGIFAVPKVGIFGNHMTAHNSLYRGNGTPFVFEDPPLSGNRFDIRESENTFAMLASIDVGFNWAFHRNWGILAGYRVVAVSGVALSDEQIPHFLAAEDDWRDIKTNGDLILHGAFAGIEARF